MAKYRQGRLGEEIKKSIKGKQPDDSWSPLATSDGMIKVDGLK
jgi:hypothetical protein